MKSGLIKSPIFLLLFFLLTACETPRFATSDKNNRTEVVNQSKKLIGSKYKYAGRSPSGFDCSGFTHYVFDKVNIHLIPVSREQARQGRPIKTKDVKPGDLIFFGKKGKVDHVGLVSSSRSGTIKVIHSTSSRGVIEEDVLQSEYWAKRMLFARDVIED